jgi:hypothetical protein
MNYILSGNLIGCYPNQCFDFVYKTKVKIYGIDKSVSVSSVLSAANPHNSIIRTNKETDGIAKFLLAETVTDEVGNYSVTLNGNYNGGTIDIDICAQKAPLSVKFAKFTVAHEMQFNITSIQPFWHHTNSSENFNANGSFKIGSDAWCEILKAFKLCVINGQVIQKSNNTALGAAKVFAFDYDLLQDDYLGMAETDENGYFQLIYSEDDFQKTIFNNLTSEYKNGPDIYFKIDSSSGDTLLKEDRKMGDADSRKNMTTCLTVNFEIE